MYDFKLLKTISNILHVVGVAIIGISVVGGGGLIYDGAYSLIVGVSILLGGGVIGLLVVLASQLVNLFLQIEENTRKRL